MDADIPSFMQLNADPADSEVYLPPIAAAPAPASRPSRNSTPAPRTHDGRATQSRAALTVKLPPFTQGNPSMWLRRVESHFRIADLTDEILQADTVLNALPEDVYRKLISRVPETHTLTYSTTKKFLLEACSLPIAERAARAIDLAINPRHDLNSRDAWGMVVDLLSTPVLGGTNKRQEISFVREIFLRQLLPEVRNQIAHPYTMPVEDLIEAAQHLTDSVKASQRLKPATQPVSSVQPEEDVEQPVNAIANRRPPNHSRWRSPGFCRYHKWFGKDARNCLPPCSFNRSKNGGGGGQQDRPPWQPKNPGPQKQ